MTIAKLPLAKDLDDFDVASAEINETLVRDLAAGGFLDPFQPGAHLAPAARGEADVEMLSRHRAASLISLCRRLTLSPSTGEGKTMAAMATLSSKFQISIPKAIRTAQHWEAGLTFAFIPKGTGVLLVPVPKREALKGLARGAVATDYRDRSERV